MTANNLLPSQVLVPLYYQVSEKHTLGPKKFIRHAGTSLDVFRATLAWTQVW